MWTLCPIWEARNTEISQREDWVDVWRACLPGKFQSCARKRSRNLKICRKIDLMMPALRNTLHTYVENYKKTSTFGPRDHHLLDTACERGQSDTNMRTFQHRFTSILGPWVKKKERHLLCQSGLDLLWLPLYPFGARRLLQKKGKMIQFTEFVKITFPSAFWSLTQIFVILWFQTRSCFECNCGFL